MKMNIYCCLLVWVLGWKVTADLRRKVIRENFPVTLSCNHPVDDKVTWSREINGSIVNLITAGGGGDTRHNDPEKRFSSLADRFKSLHIIRTSVSDSGRYFCNDEPAVVLTVIPSGRKATPPPPPPTKPATTTTAPSTTPATTTTAPSTTPATTTTAPSTTTTALPTTTLENKASALLWQMSVRAVIGLIYLIVMTSVTAVTWRTAEQIKKRRAAETDHVL